MVPGSAPDGSEAAEEVAGFRVLITVDNVELFACCYCCRLTGCRFTGTSLTH
jgi:hypothetical protein